MSVVRRRAAIGIFSNPDDLGAVTSRLHSQGIDRCLWFDMGADSLDEQQWRGAPPLSATLLGELRARYPHALVLRVDLTGGAKEEALVARTLLESAAQIVQLHDL